MSRSLAPVVTPHGSLRLDRLDDEFVLERALADRLEKSFGRGAGHGLLQLGVGETGSVLSPALAWWRDFAVRFIADLCALGEGVEPAKARDLAAPAPSELSGLIDEAPPMQGGEYLRPEVVGKLWREIGRALEVELSEGGLSLDDFLKRRDSRWRLVGRVHFNLADNRPAARSP